MAIKYFCFYHDYLDKYELLDDEQAGRLTKAVLRYAANGEITSLDQMESLIFMFLKNDIDRQYEQYEEKCEKYKKNAQKRYRKSSAENDDSAMACHGREEEDKDKDKDEYKDEYKNNYEYKDENKEEEEEEEKDEEGLPLPPTRRDVDDFVKESGCEADEEMIDMFLTYYDEKDWTVRTGEKMKNWKRALVRWIERQKRYDGSKE